MIGSFQKKEGKRKRRREKVKKGGQLKQNSSGGGVERLAKLIEIHVRLGEECYVKATFQIFFPFYWFGEREGV